MAQYLPDDPDHPDYQALERNYYKFRAGLEKRYPQVCAECEPKVIAKVQEAGYTAKTDFLRRAMERSRLNRATPKRRTLLDAANSAGRWLSWCALMLQVFWHFSMVDLILEGDIPIGEGQGWKRLLLRVLPWNSGLAALGDDLATWSFRATLLSAWWNPMFVQVYRGFSRHILGLEQWYGFQMVLVALRFFFPQLAKIDAPGVDQIRAQLAIHVFMVAMTIYVSLFILPSFVRRPRLCPYLPDITQITFLSKHSVRQDTTPLFGTPRDGAASPPMVPLSHRKEEATQNLSNVLDDILATPTPASRIHGAETSPSAFGQSRDLFQNTRSQAYDTEMDWSPTPATPPAFQAIPQTDLPFGHPETREAVPQNQFWAKVPPAPKPPSHKLFNPAPRASESIKNDREIFQARFGGGRLEPPRAAGNGGVVEFKDPAFFARGPSKLSSSGDGAGLADMFASSFSLGRDDPTPQKKKRTPGEHKNTSVNNPFSPQRVRAAAGVAEGQRRRARRARVFDAAFLTLLLGAWAYAMLYPSRHSPTILKTALAIAAALILRVGVDTIADARGGEIGGWTVAVGVSMTLCAVEVGSAAYLANKMWAEESVSQWGEQGLWTLGLMWGHQLWNAWC